MSTKFEIRCQHIVETGRRCGTPPMKGEPFCYYHRRLHQTHVLPGHRLYELPNLDNAHGIQIAITQLARALSKGLIDPKAAGKLAYSIQLAQVSLRRFKEEVVPPEQSETEFTPAMADALHIDDDFAVSDPSQSNIADHVTPAEAPADELEDSSQAEPKATPPTAPKDYRDHPLWNIQGLRPIDAPPPLPTEKPCWVPVTPKESESLCDDMAVDERKSTARQRFCVRRLRLQMALHGNQHPSTQQLLQAVVQVEEEEKNAIRNLNELDPCGAVHSARPLATKH
jgi:hypothetical protein